MSRFAYRALPTGGGIAMESPLVRGYLQADSWEELQRRLTQHGLTLLSARRQPRFWLWLLQLTENNAADQEALAGFLERAALLMEAGIPLLEALAKSAHSVHRKPLRRRLEQWRQALLSGQSLAEATASAPPIHGRNGLAQLATSLFQAAEQTGQIADCFHRLAAHYRWHLSWRQQGRQALRYPLLVIVMLLAILAMVSQQLLPGLSSLLQSLGVAPNLAARWLLGFTNWITSYGPHLLLAGAGILLLTFVAGLASPTIRLHRDRIRLRLPLIGQLHQDAQLIPYAHVWLQSWQAGVPLLDGLVLAKATLRNRYLIQQADQLIQALEAGQGLTAALQHSDLLPPLLLDLVAVGEQTGRLDHSLQQGLRLMEQQLSLAWPRRLRQLQNGLLLLAGGLIFWVLSAMLLPVYQAVGQIGRNF
jgi:type II secretory pathway component PulF